MGSTKENQNITKYKKKGKADDIRKKNAKKKKSESLEERIEKIVFKETKASKIRKNVIRKKREFESFAWVLNHVKKADKEMFAKKYYKREKQKLDKYLKADILPRWMYDELLEKIKKAYGQNE